MPHLRKILAFLILVFAVGACQRQSRVSGVFGLVENLPDSALHILNGIDRNSLSGDEQAEWGLAYCWALDRSGVDVGSDSVLRIAYDHYSRRPDAPHYARCMYYMGKYYVLADSAECVKRFYTKRKSFNISHISASYKTKHTIFAQKFHPT